MLQRKCSQRVSLRDYVCKSACVCVCVAVIVPSALSSFVDVICFVSFCFA